MYGGYLAAVTFASAGSGMAEARIAQALGTGSSTGTRARRLVTHILPEGDPIGFKDTVFGVKDSLIKRASGGPPAGRRPTAVPSRALGAGRASTSSSRRQASDVMG